MSEEPTLPYFVGVGPQRTGTTWLHEQLKTYPSLFLPEGVKETMFFDRYYEPNLKRYRSYFESASSNAKCGEIAPTYFDNSRVPERIHASNSDCKIIISLRHPAERAFSLYLHHRRKGRVGEDFDAAVERKPEILSSSHYADYIPLWYDRFGQRQVKVILLQDIKKNSAEVLQQICQFLEVEFIGEDRIKDEKVNSVSLPRFPWLARIASLLSTWLHKYDMYEVVNIGKRLGLKRVFSGSKVDIPHLSDEKRKELIAKYSSDIAYVESLLDRRLGSWKK